MLVSLGAFVSLWLIKLSRVNGYTKFLLRFLVALWFIIVEYFSILIIIQCMKILHLIRNRKDTHAFEIARAQSQYPNTEVIILLLHDGVLSSQDIGLKIYACYADVVARGISTPYETINYPQILDLVFECDRVISW